MFSFVRKTLLNLVRILSSQDLRSLDKIIHQRVSTTDAILYPEHLHYFYWESQVDFWDSNPPPVRPSQGDIGIYKEFLKQQKDKERILILGSTPELRDLAAQESGTKVFLADFSYRAPLAMLKFTNYADPLNEIWVKANWLDLPFPAHFFDVILGDLALQQFPPDLEQTFLEKMIFLLKKEGIFIGRFHFLDEAMCQRTTEDIIKKTLASPLSYWQKFILLKLRILWLFADPAKRKLNRHISVEKFDEFLRTTKTKNPLLKQVRDAMFADKDSYRNWSPPEEKELIKILSRQFSVVSTKTSQDYEDAKYYPLFLLRKLK